MELQQAQALFTKLIVDLKDEFKKEFIQWAEDQLETFANEMECYSEEEDTKLLNEIAEELRLSLPPYGVLPQETFMPSKSFDQNHTLHIDSFLYNDELVEELFDKGELNKYYCTRCDSTNVCPLTLISHSMSIQRLSFIFQSLLPPLDGKIVVDVGSRLGAVLYGAYFYSTAANIVGIEMSEDYVRLQENIIRKYKLGDRIKVLQGNLLSYANVLQSADVVVLHNVFENFLPEEEEVLCWKFLKTNIRKAKALVVTIPDMRMMLENVKIESKEFLSSWVTDLTPDNLPVYEKLAELKDIALYQVIT